MSIYLDYNATTPLDPMVREAMAPYLGERWGNAYSMHRWGRQARAAIEDAREQVADLVNADPRQVTFTSGATESNNTALKGCTWEAGTEGPLYIGATEHPSICDTAHYLAQRGRPVVEITVDPAGRVTPETLRATLEAHPRPALVSVMWANNETGTIQPVPKLASVCAEFGAPIHSDAVQALGKVPVDFQASGLALMSLSGHKLYGPQGMGALVGDPEQVTLAPLLHGGGHERGRRSGTENVAGIVGLGAAARVAREQLAARTQHLQGLRDRLEAQLFDLDLGIEPLSTETERLPNTSCLLIPGVEAETLLMNLDLAGVAVSSGSACSSGSLKPSSALLAMGITPEQARTSLRVSVGTPTTAEEVDAFAAILGREVHRLRYRSVALA